jgi:hypothetical protein
MGSGDKGYAGTISQPRTLRTAALEKVEASALEDNADYDAQHGIPKSMVHGEYDDAKSQAASKHVPRPSAQNTPPFKLKGA